MERRPLRRLWFLFGLMLITRISAADAQTILLRADVTESASVSTVETFAGSVPAHRLATVPSPDLHVVIYVDSLTREDLPGLKTELTALFQAVKTDHPVSLILARKSGTRTIELLKSVVRLQSALQEVAKNIPEISSACTLSDLDQLASIQSVIPDSGWPAVLLVGRFEEVDADWMSVAESRLALQFCRRQWRITGWIPDGKPWRPLQEAAKITAGLPVVTTLAEYGDFLNAKIQSFTTLSWQHPELERGFHFYRAILRDASGNALAVVPALSSPPGIGIPSLDVCRELRDRARVLRELAKSASITEAQHEEFRTNLALALAVNPYDAEALHLGTAFFRSRNLAARLADLLEALTRIEPRDIGVRAELGHALYASRDFERAERVLMRARELQPGSPAVSEELARIRGAAQDNAAALALAEESLKLNPRNQDLWFWAAGLAQQLKDYVRAADAYERGLELGGSRLDARTALIQLLLEQKNSQTALKHARLAVTGSLPDDADILSTYAAFMEQLGENRDAMALWERTLSADPKRESAHYRKSYLLLESGDAAGAMLAADAGLSAARDSARLYLLKSKAQEKLGWGTEARKTLRNGAAISQDPQLLLRRAEVEDAYGGEAPNCYRALVTALQKAPGSQLLIPALERGFEISLREADLESARWFSERLEQAGRKELAALLNKKAKPREDTILVPGGVKALMYVAGGREPATTDRFLSLFGRTLLNHIEHSSDKEAQNYAEGISDYFKRIMELSRYGTRKGAVVEIVLSTRDVRSARAADEVLQLLGWRLRTSRQAIRVEGVEKGAAAGRRLTGAALNIDEIAMQEALQSGSGFKFEITDDQVPVLFGEDLWGRLLYTGRRPAGGFAEAFLNHIDMVKLYVGLESLDRDSVSALLQDVGLKQLAEKYADLLYQHASSMALIGGKVSYPGGIKAAAIWEQLAGAKRGSPGEFFRALLKKDEGKLLAFFNALSQLDSRHQQFFTQSLPITQQYYDLFKDSPDLKYGAARAIRDSTFMTFFSSLPLDPGGHVLFPGSPEVWLVAKGQSDSTGRTSSLLRKASKLVAPEMEWQILTRLMDTGYKAGQREMSELDNFLAVAAVDLQRSEPLDERAALTLAQQYVAYQSAWPYLTALGGLGAAEFEKFFALGAALNDYDVVQQNDIMGSLHSLLKILCLLHEAGRLDAQQSASIFASLCDQFLKARIPADFAAASLDLIREIMKSALQKDPSDPDQALAALLLDSPIPPSLESADKTRRLASAAARQASFRQVLELQKVTPLRTLFEIYDTTRILVAGKGDPQQQLKALEAASLNLLTVSIPDSVKPKGNVKDNLLSFRPEDVKDAISQLRRLFIKKNAKTKDVQKITTELLSAINHQVRIALSGILYACYLSPDDLLVSADPLLLRKHQYVKFTNERKNAVPFYTEGLNTDQEMGSCFFGGFADFGIVAGKTLFPGAKYEDDQIAPFFWAQLGSIRGSRWGDLRDEDLHLVGLKIRAAREWLVRAAQNPALLADLADATSGLLSFSRKADLVYALESHDWETVWQSCTLTDLYFLGDDLLRRYVSNPWDSPTLKALRSLAGGRDSHVDVLGGNLNRLIYSSRPQLRRLPPYEFYEGLMLLEKIATRTSEFKVWLAEYFDRAGLPASELAALAEPLALDAFSTMRLNDIRDWNSIVEGYNKLSNESVTRVRNAK